MKILCFDPSGNKNEGNGTTGFAVFENDELVDFGDVKSSDHDSQESYWASVGSLIAEKNVDVVVYESYRLFAHKAKSQSWSELETPQLIGYLRMICWHKKIKCVEQNPSDKTRVADKQLAHLGVIEKKGNKYYCLGRSTNLHQRDAIRHGVFFIRYRKEKLL